MWFTTYLFFLLNIFSAACNFAIGIKDGDNLSLAVATGNTIVAALLFIQVNDNEHWQ